MTDHNAAAAAFMEAADHLDKLAELVDGPNADVITLAYRPAAYAFRVRAERELAAAQTDTRCTHHDAAGQCLDHQGHQGRHQPPAPPLSVSEG